MTRPSGTSAQAGVAAPAEGGSAGADAPPRRAALVLTSLILVAAIANLNLLVANVALPDTGMGLSVPACLLAADAPTDGTLFATRVIGGVAAGMA
jgi:hypothetical protein